MRKYIPLVLFIFSWPALSADIHGRVVRVLDGDTIEVMDSRKAVRIRLVNIDAPEKKQDYGRWSTDMMKSLVAGKTVIRPRSRQWWQLFRMVSQWHVDVVIVERR
ncbi:thermonuclease family protein, partial [Escherichia coli]